jgi:asparagine synthase (glutamine-hydrolysing)
MCGITLCISDVSWDASGIVNRVLGMTARGPDKTITKNFIIGSKRFDFIFHRLRIQGSNETRFIENDDYILLCNGEVYPHGEFAIKYPPHSCLPGESDCEWILHEYTTNGLDAIQELLRNSEYALLIVNKKSGNVLIARDRFGIRPLYEFTHVHAKIWASEMKYVNDTVFACSQVSPDSWFIYNPYISSINEVQSINNNEPYVLSSDDIIIDGLYNSLMSAVSDRLMYTDAEVGYLLSGGMDSSIICALAQKMSSKPIRTFSIGMDENATDVIAAITVAKFIGSDHTTVILPKEHFLMAIPEVIRIIESWDVTTVRASTGMYLIAKYIAENTNIKVLMTGEGSDELFGSYRYFINSPSPQEHYVETRRLLDDIHFFDVLRCDRTISNNGLEARVPFLDSRVVNFVHSHYSHNDYKIRDGLMKWHLRQVAKTFNLLPEEIYNRPKEAFSDGVSKQDESWHSILTEAHKTIDVDISLAPTQEGCVYKQIFSNHHGKERMALIPYQWLPKWCGDEKDPSARNLLVKECCTIQNLGVSQRS